MQAIDRSLCGFSFYDVMLVRQPCIDKSQPQEQLDRADIAHINRSFQRAEGHLIKRKVHQGRERLAHVALTPMRLTQDITKFSRCSGFLEVEQQAGADSLS